MPAHRARRPRRPSRLAAAPSVPIRAAATGREPPGSRRTTTIRSSPTRSRAADLHAERAQRAEDAEQGERRVGGTSPRDGGEAHRGRSRTRAPARAVRRPVVPAVSRSSARSLAITAYATGDFALALRELRTYRRISGRDDQIAAHGRQRARCRASRSRARGRSRGRPQRLPGRCRVELAIAMSGARLDLGAAGARACSSSTSRSSIRTAHSSGARRCSPHERRARGARARGRGGGVASPCGCRSRCDRRGERHRRPRGDLRRGDLRRGRTTTTRHPSRTSTPTMRPPSAARTRSR